MYGAAVRCLQRLDQFGIVTNGRLKVTQLWLAFRLSFDIIALSKVYTHNFGVCVCVCVRARAHAQNKRKVDTSPGNFGAVVIQMLAFMIF
jgi:hypothetical protein